MSTSIHLDSQFCRPDRRSRKEKDTRAGTLFLADAICSRAPLAPHDRSLSGLCSPSPGHGQSVVKLFKTTIIHPSIYSFSKEIEHILQSLSKFESRGSITFRHRAQTLAHSAPSALACSHDHHHIESLSRVQANWLLSHSSIRIQFQSSFVALGSEGSDATDTLSLPSKQKKKEKNME